MSTKRCFKCACEKPLDDFYKHARMKDGRLARELKRAGAVFKDYRISHGNDIHKPPASHH